MALQQKSFDPPASEKSWKSTEWLEAMRSRVHDQAESRLFPELADLPETGIYFLHIPKTAGTSTNHLLDRITGMQREPSWMWDQLVVAQPRTESTNTFYSGHFHLHLEPYLLRRLRRLVMLRDPVARTVSHYLHVKRAPDHPFFAYASSMSFYEFCVDPATRHMVENYQARYLVDFGLDPRIPASFCTPADLSSYRLQIILEQSTLGLVEDELLLKAAQANLAKSAAIGLTERFSESMARFATAIGYAGSTDLFEERLNASSNGEQIKAGLDSRSLLAVLQATLVDQVLYRTVLETFR